ncbi:anhydro-N-acetylmuramic acid kinase [Flaviaesturariibacter terrae]
MIYRAMGLMSGSSLDGLDLVFAEFHVNAGHWTWEIRAAATYPYTDEWAGQLRTAADLPARAYLQLDANYGRYLGDAVNQFIEEHALHYQVGLVASHGHTAVHAPVDGVSAQLGDGATIAAATGLAVVSDLRSLDVANGGQGAPIVPLGESLLFTDFRLFLNLGGIANISVHNGPPLAFDVYIGTQRSAAGLRCMPRQPGAQHARRKGRQALRRRRPPRRNGHGKRLAAGAAQRA